MYCYHILDQFDVKEHRKGSKMSLIVTIASYNFRRNRVVEKPNRHRCDLAVGTIWLVLTIVSLLCSVNFSLQGIRECRHHIQPRLFDHNHFVLAHEIHVEHAVVTQAHRTRRRDCLFFIVAMIVANVVSFLLMRHRSRALAFFSTPYMGFRKNATMLREIKFGIHGYNRTKGSLKWQKSTRKFSNIVWIQETKVNVAYIYTTRTFDTSFERAKAGRYVCSLLRG